MDDGVGAGQEAQGQAELPPGAGEGQELRLGGVEEAVLEVQQQQEVPCAGPVQEAGRGRGRILPQGRVHRRHPQEQVSVQQAGDERRGGQVRPRGRDDRLAGVHGGAAARLGGAGAAHRHTEDRRRDQAAGGPVYLQAEVQGLPGRRGEVQGKC